MITLQVDIGSAGLTHFHDDIIILAKFYEGVISLLTCWLKLVLLVCPAPLCIKAKWKEKLLS